MKIKKSGTIQFEHTCKKWKKGMKIPYIIPDKKDSGRFKCSLCRELPLGRIIFK